MPFVLRGSTKLTLAFATTLALSAAFVASWGWLLYGGAIERAAIAERAAAQNALDVAAESLAQELVRAARDDGCALELDASGQIVGPFCSAAAPSPEPSIAEMAAFARLGDGRPRDGQVDALAFLQHAATAHDLTPQGWLMLARLQGERDARLGAETLATAPATVNDAHCGPLSFRLLAALLAATWPGADVDTLTATLLAELRRVPAGGVAVVADAIVQASPSLNADVRLQAIVSAANAFPGLRDRPAPSTATPGPEGSAVVPVVDTADPDAIARVFVLAAASTLRAADHGRRQAAASQPDYDLRLAFDIDAIDPAPTRAMPGLGQTWGAVARQWAMSHVLALAARGAFALALLTFVLGNLAVLRLVRREVALARLRRVFVDVV